MIASEPEHLANIKTQAKKFPETGLKLIDKSRTWVTETLEYYDSYAEGVMQRWQMISQLQRQYAAELKIRLKESEEINTELEKEITEMQKNVNKLENGIKKSK